MERESVNNGVKVFLPSDQSPVNGGASTFIMLKLCLVKSNHQHVSWEKNQLGYHNMLVNHLHTIAKIVGHACHMRR